MYQEVIAEEREEKVEQVLCDKCGKILERKKPSSIDRYSLHLTYHKDALHKYELDLELCAKCSTEFATFMLWPSFEKCVKDSVEQNKEECIRK